MTFARVAECVCVTWQFIFVEFAIQIYNIQRASRLPRPHKKEVKNKFERPSDPVPQEKPEDGSEKATWRKVLIGVEMVRNPIHT